MISSLRWAVSLYTSFVLQCLSPIPQCWRLVDNFWMKILLSIKGTPVLLGDPSHGIFFFYFFLELFQLQLNFRKVAFEKLVVCIQDSNSNSPLFIALRKISVIMSTKMRPSHVPAYRSPLWGLQDKLSPEEQADFQFSTLGDLQEAIKQIQEK